MASMKKKKREINDELASMVKQKYQIAADANREAHQRALDCLNQMKGTLFDTRPDYVSAFHLRTKPTR